MKTFRPSPDPMPVTSMAVLAGQKSSLPGEPLA
jgi:hypothetical protein